MGHHSGSGAGQLVSTHVDAVGGHGSHGAIRVPAQPVATTATVKTWASELIFMVGLSWLIAISNSCNRHLGNSRKNVAGRKHIQHTTGMNVCHSSHP